LRAWFLRYGLLTVFIPAVLPIPLPLKVFVLSAGALGVRPSTFLLVVLAARAPRYLGLAFLGAKLGGNSADYLKQHMWHLLGLAVALFVVLYAAMLLAGRYRSGRMAENPS
jgi:membrane protein DedA with SNARE-associated domain